MTARFSLAGGDDFRDGACRNCGLKWKAHAGDTCLFEPTEFDAPEIEKWISSLWANTHPYPWGWIMLGTGEKVKVKFMVQLTEYSTTRGYDPKYVEFTVRGMDVE